MSMRGRDNHVSDYMISFVLVIAFGVAFWIFRDDYFLLKIFTFLACSSYVTWGIVHHLKEGRLNREIIMEYVLLGTLVFLLLYAVIG